MTTSGISPLLPTEARTHQGHRAGVISRLVAAGIDGFVVGGVLLLGYAGLAGLLFLVDPRSFSFPAPALFFSMTAALTVLVVYLTLSWWITGRTYGSQVMGLRVVSHNGSTMTLVGALVRALFCSLFPIGLLWVAVNRENRSVQDVVLRTSVIYDWHRGPEQGQPPH